MTDDNRYWAYSPTRIRLSPEAKRQAREYGLSDAEFGRFLLAQHLERGDPFAHDTDVPAGRDQLEGFRPGALDPFLGDVGTPAGRGDLEGFAPRVLEETASELRDAFAGDAAQHPPGRNQIEGFRGEPERHTNADTNAQRIHDAESYWQTKW